MDILGSQSEFTAQTYKKLAHTGAHFQHKEFTDCTFIKCAFSDSTFQDCTFRGCFFKDCEMNLVKIPGCTFADTRFENSRLVGVDWTDTSLAKNKLMLGKPIGFTGCALNHSIFMWMNLKDATLTKCVARDADFSEADLTRANCTLTDFAGSRFWHTDLTGADFTGATNYTIAAHLNTLKKTKFSLPEAMSLLHSLDIILSEEQ